MADTKLKDRQDLADSERSTALLALVSDATNAGVTRKYTIAQLAEALHAVNELEVVWEETTLIEADIDADPTNAIFHSGAVSETATVGSSTDQANYPAQQISYYQDVNLDFKAGNSGPRHNFTDNYESFEIVVAGTQASSGDTRIEANTFGRHSINGYILLNSTAKKPIIIHKSGAREGTLILKRQTDTSFRMGAIGTPSNPLGLVRIIGWKQTIRPSSL